MPSWEFERHETCTHLSGEPLIQWIKTSPGDLWETTPDTHLLLMVLYGRAELTCDGIGRLSLPTGTMCTIPKNTQYRLATAQSSNLLFIRLDIKVWLCEQVSLSDFQENLPDEPCFHGLTIKEPMFGVVNTLVEILKKGIGCNYYYGLKTKELLYLLKAFYTKSELAPLFAPLNRADHSFADFVLTHYAHYRTVQELVNASGYPASTFNKLFRKTFAQSPYQWMQERKARQVYLDIQTSRRCFKELAEEHGFRSLSHFTNFCKAQFGHGPRSIRKMHASVSAGARSESATFEL